GGGAGCWRVAGGTRGARTEAGGGAVVVHRREPLAGTARAGGRCVSAGPFLLGARAAPGGGRASPARSGARASWWCTARGPGDARASRLGRRGGGRRPRTAPRAPLE